MPRPTLETKSLKILTNGPEEIIMYNCNTLAIASKNSNLVSEWLKWSYKRVTVTQQHISKVILRKTLKKPKQKNPIQTLQKSNKTSILGPKLQERL